MPPTSFPTSSTEVIGLSKREMEVLALMKMGMPYKQIGRKLYLSINTIKKHSKSIFRKLSVHSRTQAVAVAYQRNVL